MPTKTKDACRRAARKALGKDAVEGRDFALNDTGAGWEFSAIEAANEPAKKARAARKPKQVAEEARTFAPAGETKQAMLMKMMQATGGATSGAMEQATGWKPHSVRGLIGTLKKRGIQVESVKELGKPVSYRIAPAKNAPDPVGDVV